ncbi:MAG TPA: hypothetical protein DCE56_07570 [Cyanobacteria bacterium UBA8553]|nr:hypothetical protein [Cyanobacteria bacterium UBA8553]HAJ63527.1 hypothetical protein [Cyanobacteria bacterium UBA8543]
MNNQITQVQLALAVTPPIALAVTPQRRSAFKAMGNKKKPGSVFPKVFEVSDETHYDFETYSSLTDHGDFD